MNISESLFFRTVLGCSLLSLFIFPTLSGKKKFGSIFWNLVFRGKCLLKLSVISLGQFSQKCLKGRKLTKPNFSEKCSFWGKSQKIPTKYGFWRLIKVYVNDGSCFTLKMMLNNVLYYSAKSACLLKSGSSVMAQNAVKH